MSNKSKPSINKASDEQSLYEISNKEYKRIYLCNNRLGWVS